MRTGIPAVLVLVLSIAALFPPVLAVNDPPPGGGWVTNDWTITDNRTYRNVNIYLNHGNLVIRNGCSLTLDNVDLQMRLDTDGQFQIEVQPGGTLVVKNTSLIYSANAVNYYFRVQSGANATLANSTFRDVGVTYTDNPADCNGVYIASENVSIDSCTFQDSTYGVYLDRVSPTVSNCVFRTIDNAGVYVMRSEPTILRNDISGCTYGVYSYRSSPTIARNSFTTNYYGLYIEGESSAEVHNNSFADNYYFGLTVNHLGTPEVQDNNFRGNGPWYWGWGAAAYYTDRAGGRFLRNTIQNVDNGMAVHCADSASPLIESCDIETTNWPSIYTTTHARPRFLKTNITCSYDTTVYCTDRGTAEFDRCKLLSGWGVGAYALSDGELVLHNTTLRAANSYGVRSDDYGGLTAFDSEITSGSVTLYSTYSAWSRLVRTTLSSSWSLAAYVLYGSELELEGSSLSGETYGAYIYYNSKLRARASAINSKDAFAAVVTSSTAELTNTTVYSLRSYGMYSGGEGIVRAVNSSVTSGTSSYIYLDTDGGSRYDFLNTVFDQARVTFTEPTSVLNASWYLNMAVKWQSGVPAAFARIDITDAQGARVVGTNASARGDLNWTVIQEYTRTQAGYTRFSPFNITASQNGISRTEKRDIRGNTVLFMTLVDLQGPRVEITSPQNGLRTNESRVEFRGKASDNGSGLARVEYALDSGNWTPTQGMESWSVSLDLPEGRHAFKVRAFDVSGTSETSEIALLVDTVMELELTAPAQGSLLNRTAVHVEGMSEPYATVTVNGVPALVEADGRFELELNLSDGKHALQVSGRDETGNQMELTREITVDTRAPLLRISEPYDGQAFATPQVPFSGEVEPGSRLFIAGLQQAVSTDGTFSTIVVLKEGNVTVEVRAVDLAGNGNSLRLVVVVDLTPPSLQVTSPAGELLTNDPVLALSGLTDGGVVTVDDVPLEVISGQFSAKLRLKEGLNEVRVTALDGVGNARTALVLVTLDTLPPILQVVSPSPRHVTNDGLLSVSGAAEVGAVLTVNGMTVQAPNGSFSHQLVLKVGENTVSVRAVDRAGNVVIVNRTVVLDQTPPPLAITSPSSGYRTEASRVTLRGTTEPGAAVTVNGLKAQVDSNGKFSIDVPISEGENSLVVTAVDPAGNPTTKVHRITRAGALALTEKELPLLILGLAVGAAAGMIGGYLAGRRRRRPAEEPPEEPRPGLYDVDRKPYSGLEGAEEPSPGPGAAPSPPPIPVAPSYAPSYDRYGPEETDVAYPEGRRRHGRREAMLQSVPEAEDVQPSEETPMPQAQEPDAGWEEETRIPPQPRKPKEPVLQESLEDIMSKLKK